MKFLKYLLLLILLSNTVVAQSFDVIRNDDALQTIQSNNLQKSQLSTDEKGILYVFDTSSESAQVPVSNAIDLNGVGSLLVGEQLVTLDTVETGSTDTILNVTAHIAAEGDVIRFPAVSQSASLFRTWSTVCETTINTITLCNALPFTPTNGQDIAIMRGTPVGAYGSSSSGLTSLNTNINIDAQQSASTGILKPEDSLAGSGDAGVFTLAHANDGLASRCATGDYCPFTTDNAGIAAHSPVYSSAFTAASQTIRLEDDAFANLSAVTMAGAVNNRSQSTFNSTNGDVIPFAANDYGSSIIAMSPGSQQFADSPIQAEDVAFNNASGVVMAGAVNNTTPTSFNGTQGDATPVAVNGFGSINTYAANYNNITSATTTTVKSGAGWLKNIVINKAVASASITIYDNTSAAGNKIGTITFPGTLTQDVFSLEYHHRFVTGLTIVTSGATDITVSYD